MFKTNVGSADRVIRIVLGVIILSLFFIYPGAWWRYYALIGIVPILTGLAGTCPLYSIFGLSTCPAHKT
jgi:hypothetical protein